MEYFLTTRTWRFVIACVVILLSNRPAIPQSGNSRIAEEFTTANSGTFKDTRDKQVYEWIKIGEQIWMAENLNFYTETGSWCYENKESNCNVYGRLYDWITAKQACPEGWHLPSDNEWKQLEMYLGMSQAEADEEGSRGTGEGGKLKEAGTTHWHSQDDGATNSSGFAALPGGYRTSDEVFYHVGYYGTWWSSTVYGCKYAGTRRLNADHSYIGRNGNDRNYGFSVRCLRD